MIGRLGVELMAMRTAFVLTIIGVQLTLLGRDAFRILAFPLLFLFFMPAPLASASGIAPRTMARVVITMGRSRVVAARSIAANFSIP